MATLDKNAVNNLLKTFIDPHSDKDLVSAGNVLKIEIIDQKIHLTLRLGYPAKNYIAALKSTLTAHLRHLVKESCHILIEVETRIVSHAVQQALKPLDNIKNIIAVASGKGGVGKSTTSVNLALALASEGANVGILDADIYGPSIPMMLGLSGHPDSEDGKTMLPKMGYGIQTNSIGYLIDQEQPMIWRGPMVTSALQQLLKDTQWNELDYLIVDLPPGTGDIQLTLSQQIPVSGAVIVTTPQDIALLDAQRGLGMFEKVSVSVLGIVENMSTHICSECGHEEAIFGQGGGQIMAKKNSTEFLGSLPLDIHIRQLSDAGKPCVVADPDSAITQSYQKIARKMTAKLALKTKDFKNKFPNIVVE
ncbi:MAG: iron-sulfur cluster carrier protein ApbC [Methylococcales bacterium]|nr:iron-sulfur cluster carrier protein ApbC [Methylococcales bacterium]